MPEHSNYLLIGGGLASAMAAKSIRESDDTGTVTILGNEPYRPYDRPPLSKDNLNKPMSVDDIASVDDSFYERCRVTVRTGVMAQSIERASKIVRCAGAEEFSYDKLLLAPGSAPKPLDAQGNGIKDVLYLRNYDDSVKLREALDRSRTAVLVGAGYIGIEVAAACAARGIATTVIEPKAQVWSKFASKKSGEFLERHFERLGVKFLFKDGVASVDKEGAGFRVHTKSGQGLHADLVLAGVGVAYNTQIAKDAGLEVDEKERIRVDETLQTTEDTSIWAAGDPAAYFDKRMGKVFNAEHYMNAKWMGELVGRNMAGDAAPYTKVPYFFSDMGSLHMVLRGNAENVEETRILGSTDREDFIELYRDEADGVAMAIAFSHDGDKLDRLSDQFEQLVLDRVNVDRLSAGDFDL
jgi:3-phenylpropionate/trans-cinnamate dioxygenase ferredoxin reductase subunit